MLRKNKTSKILIEIAEIYEMKQLLTSRTITYSNKKSSNIINLVYVIFLLIENRISCKTIFDLHFSNYYSIEIIFNLRIIEQFTAKKRRFKKTNTTLLKNYIKQKLDRMFRNHLRNEKKNKRVCDLHHNRDTTKH